MALLDKNLRFLILHQPISHEDLGEKIGMSQPNVGRIFNGKTANPGYLTVQALAHHFDVSLNDLLTRDLEVEGRADPSQSVPLDPEIMASALVTVDKALKHYRVDFERLYEHSELLMLAYRLRLQQPRTMTKDQYALFDQAVISMFREVGDVGGNGGGTPAANRRGKAKASPAPKARTGRSAAGRTN